VIIDNPLKSLGDDRERLRRVTQRIPAARRYLFDEDASRFLGEFIRDFGDTILRNVEFALPPFDNIYLEMNVDVMVNAIGRGSTDQALGVEGKDIHVGYLITNGRVTVLGLMEEEQAGVISPIEYVLDSPPEPGLLFSEDEEQDAWTRLALMCGTTLNDMPSETVRRDILYRNRVSFALSPSVQDRLRRPVADLRRELAFGHYGDLRNVWAALLLLNQPTQFVTERVPPTRRIVRGKMRAYATYEVIRVNLAQTKVLARAVRGSKRSSPVGHEVAGHFMHFHVDRACDHNWSQMPDLERRWTCSKCGGRRTWRVAFSKGDGERGFVSTAHVVTHKRR
jgi:hypothetical protein